MPWRPIRWPEVEFFVHFDNISGKKAEVYVDTEVHNSGKQTRTVAVETVLADAGDVP